MGSFNLGALTSGFEGGYEAVTDARRNKLIDKALNLEISQMGERKKSRKAAYERFGNDYSTDDDFMPETWGSRLLNWGRGRLGFGKQQAIDPAVMEAPQQFQPAEFNAPLASIPNMNSGMPGYAHGGTIDRYAHGGSVRNMVKGYAGGGRARALYAGVKGFSNGGRSLTPNQTVGYYAHGGAIPSLEEQLAREATAEQQLSRELTAEQREAMRKRQKAAEKKSAKSKPSRSAAKAGTRISPITGSEVKVRPKSTKGRLTARAAATGAGRAAAGVAALPAAMYGAEQIGKTVGALTTGGDLTDEEIGMTSTEEYRDQLGMTDPSENELLRVGGDLVARGIGVAGDVGNAVTFGMAGKAGDWLANKIAGVDPEQEAAVRALDVDKPPVDVAAHPAPAQPTGGGGGISQTTPGAAAPATGADQTGVEDDPIIDFSQVHEIRPEDMPSKGQKEWEDERNFYAAQAVANGENPLDAMKAVDAKQMRGFTMYAQQAFQLLRAGNAPAAVNALYAAYQYFPNGVNVRFGIMKGKDGEPVIIGMGTNEESGEPTGDPTVITAESLSVQIENMTNPAAFKAWTKDWRDTEQKIREWMEGEKPTLQSEAIYRDRMGRAAIARAEAALSSAKSNPHGLNQSDYNLAYGKFVDSQELRALQDEPLALELADIMSRLYLRSPQTPFPSIVKMVMQAHDAGALDEMVEQYGLN